MTATPTQTPYSGLRTRRDSSAGVRDARVPYQPLSAFVASLQLASGQRKESTERESTTHSTHGSRAHAPTHTSALRQKADPLVNRLSMSGSSNYRPRFSQHQPSPIAITAPGEPFSPASAYSQPTRMTSPYSAHSSSAYRSRGSATASPYDPPRSRGAYQARGSAATAASHGALSSSAASPSCSPHGIAWPVSVSLGSCANKASRDLMEYLMRKHHWREATDQTATILWTDQKVARSYKSFRTIAQNSSWFNGNRERDAKMGVNQTTATPTATAHTHTHTPHTGPTPPDPFPDRSGVRFTNHLPDMHAFVTKGYLAQTLGWYHQLFPNRFDFLPSSWDLGISAELKQMQETMEEARRVAHATGAPPRTYILKPHAGRQGEGIALAQKWSDVVALMAANPGRHYVASEYIADPLLLDGFKFDCRVYVLVESLQPFRIVLFKEGLARLATTKYAPPNPSNISQSFMHLTNYSLNRHNTNEFQQSVERNGASWNDFQDESLTELSANTASKRSIRTALLQLRLQGVPINIDAFWTDVGEIVEKTLCSMWPAMQGAYTRHFPDMHNVDTIKMKHTSTGRTYTPQTQAQVAQQQAQAQANAAQARANASVPPARTRPGSAVSRTRPGSAVPGSTHAEGPTPLFQRSSPSPVPAHSPTHSPTTTVTPGGSDSSADSDAEHSSEESDSDLEDDDHDNDDHSGTSDDDTISTLASPTTAASSTRVTPQASTAKLPPRSGGRERDGGGRASGSSTSSSARVASPAPQTAAASAAGAPITSYPIPPALPPLLVPSSPSHCFHLLGFDILLDANLKCWLLEVNAAPSMNLDSGLDKRIKLAVMERSFEVMGLIPPAAAAHASMPLFDPSKDGEDESSLSADEDAEEIDTGHHAHTTTGVGGARSIYSMSSNVIARPTQYKAVSYGGAGLTLEEKEMQHTMVLKQTRKYTSLDLEYDVLRPDQTMRPLFPFGSATVQRMYLTFTAKRYSSGLSLGAFNRLLTMYGIVQRPSGGNANPNSGGGANGGGGGGGVLVGHAGESDLIYMRILRKHHERVMSFSSFCHALVALGVTRFPHVAQQIDAFNMLIHDIERRQALSLERGVVRRAALEAARQRDLLDSERSISPTDEMTDATTSNHAHNSAAPPHSSPVSRSSSMRASPTYGFSPAASTKSRADTSSDLSTRVASSPIPTAASVRRDRERVGASSLASSPVASLSSSPAASPSKTTFSTITSPTPIRSPQAMTRHHHLHTGQTLLTPYASGRAESNATLSSSPPALSAAASSRQMMVQRLSSAMAATTFGDARPHAKR